MTKLPKYYLLDKITRYFFILSTFKLYPNNSLQLDFQNDYLRDDSIISFQRKNLSKDGARPRLDLSLGRSGEERRVVDRRASIQEHAGTARLVPGFLSYKTRQWG